MTQLCLEVQGAVRHENRPADRALEFALRRSRHLYANERRAVAEQTYALLRQRRLVDYLLEAGFPGLERVGVTRQDMLRLALSRVLLGEEPEAVAGIMKLARSEAAAISRAQESRHLLGKLGRVERLGIEASLPNFLAQKFIEEFGEEAATAAQAMNVRAPLCVRANRLKGDREALRERLKREGIEATPGQFGPDSLIVSESVNLFSLASFKEGLFEIQDEGSQLLGALVDAPPRIVVDACAGAGGKTLQLAAQMKNRGELFALDISARRLEDLRKRARRAGAHNVRVVPLDEEDAAKETLARLSGAAERVLVDAPCSGTGTFRRKPDARYRMDEAALATYVARQHELLAAYAPLVKPKGRLIYGTCSMLREENEAVAEAFLRAHSDFALASADTWLPKESALPLTRDGMLRLYTHKHGTDGFFGAVMIRAA